MGNHLADIMAGRQPDSEREGWLSELVAARICHDLVSPVGAIGNGLDLVREMGARDADDMALIGQSAARTAAILKLHRLAFGPSAAEGESYGRRALADRLEPVIAARRVALTITGTDGPDLPGAAARLLALMGLAGRALAGREGRIIVAFAPNAGLPLSVSAEGSHAAWPPDLEALVRERARPTTPRQVEFALLPLAARAAGARIEPAHEPGRATLAAVAG